MVQDVAVMCKVLKSEGNSGRSATTSRHKTSAFPPVPPPSDLDRHYSGPPAVMDLDRQYAVPPEPGRPSSAPMTRQSSAEGMEHEA